MFLAFFVGLLVFVAVYGSMCYWLGMVKSRKAAQRGNLMVGFVFLMALLWVPSVAVTVGVASLIPLQWGHAGEMIAVASLIGGMVVFGAMIFRFGAEISRDPSVGTASPDAEAVLFRCGKCAARISPESISCSNCGFVFGVGKG